MNPMETHGAVSWIEHSGPDSEKAKEFFQTVLGRDFRRIHNRN